MCLFSSELQMWGRTDTPLVSLSGTHLIFSLMLVSGEARVMLRHCQAALVLETVVRNYLNRLASFLCEKYENVRIL